MAVSYLASPQATRKVLARHGHSAKKPLGQNFLVNDGVVERICELSDVGPHDAVLEVGPGIGTLTVALAPRARCVVALERDADLLPVLQDTCHAYDNVKVLGIDALEVKQADLDAAYSELLGRPGVACEATPGQESAAGSAGAAAPNKLISNLPYAVAATIVLDFFQRFDSLRSATVMVQSEVADRMEASVGTKDYGAYTVKLALLARPVGRFQVAPHNFMPAPHVTSSVIRLDRLDTCPAPHDAAMATLAADAAFFTRRKTIANSMKTYFSGRAEGEGLVSVVPAVLETAGIDARRRGETLSLDEFITLGRALDAAMQGEL